MCIDFTDLNRACPKDSYSLPRIDALVDSTAGCQMMSFLDAFQGYNQIFLESEDQENKFRYGTRHFLLPRNAIWAKKCRSNLSKTVTSEEAVSVVLVTAEGKELQPVYYVSKVLQGAEPKYPPIEKLALALIVAIRNSAILLISSSDSIDNQPLKHILGSLNASRRMIKWAVELSGHGIEFEPRPAIKAQVLADFILKVAAGARKVHTFSDTQLVVSQVDGQCKARQGKMTKYLAKLWEEMDKFEEFILEQIPREQNSTADQLAKLASSNQFINRRIITLLSAEKPTVSWEEEKKEEIGRFAVGENLTSTWTTPIVQFLKEGILPKDQREARKVKLKAAIFVLIDGELYKFSSPLLKCLNLDRAEYVMRKIHEGSCGNHSGVRSLARKVLRQGYC
ncbi:UNVERIFIED_CONTAM: hypothetical protein Sradi_4404800 [Sesamum radiatum]|uniref:RNase H type-1 domain-containing protein n=1 Tax=Sesamum radiatum TaxID=300843 RepID=A0AAW2NPB5_SESRA